MSNLLIYAGVIYTIEEERVRGWVSGAKNCSDIFGQHLYFDELMHTLHMYMKRHSVKVAEFCALVVSSKPGCEVSFPPYKM
jgi:hypothetical protein